MNRDMEIIKAVAVAADSSYQSAEHLGQQAAQVFRQRRAQVTGLENVVNAAVKVSDVLDYVKKQIAKHDSWRMNGIGEELLKVFDRDLREQIATLRLTEPVTDPAERQKVHLLLIREFVKQFAANFEYCRAKGNPEGAVS